MHWLWTIFVGLVAGVLAKAIMPGKQNMGLFLTIGLGIAGSLVATFIGRAIGWYDAGEGARFIGSTVGALLVLFVYGQIQKNKG
jgi:uncharacterized membrane protein YeaQ/YmgE (transglycosylase-associated protein family)